MIDFVKEVQVFIESVKAVNYKKLNKKIIIFEMISNGVAALIAYFFYNLIRSYFVVDSNLKYAVKKRFAPSKMKATEISQNDFDWLMDWVANPIIFVFSIVVFSYVEQVMQNYLNNRNKI